MVTKFNFMVRKKDVGNFLFSTKNAQLIQHNITEPLFNKMLPDRYLKPRKLKNQDMVSASDTQIYSLPKLTMVTAF